MCMGCMSNADFVVTSGILGAASIRIGARQLLPRAPRWTRKVTDEEAADFLASLRPAGAQAELSSATGRGPEGGADHHLADQLDERILVGP